VFSKDEECLRRALDSTNRGAVIVVIASDNEISKDTVKSIREWGYRAMPLKMILAL